MGIPIVINVALAVWPRKAAQWFDLGLKQRLDIRVHYIEPGRDDPDHHYDILLVDGDSPGPNFIAHYKSHLAIFGIPHLFVLGQPRCPALMAVEWDPDKTVFISKPYLIEDVLKGVGRKAEEIAAERAFTTTPPTPPANAPSAKVSKERKLGYLSTLRLGDLIQMLCLSTWTGKIEITDLSTGETGVVVIHDGVLFHAATAHQTADNACHTMLNWGRCEFNFIEDIVIPERTIQAGWQEVMLEGVRLIDESRLPG